MGIARCAAAGAGLAGTKNGATHRVWLPQAALAIIEELATDDTKSGFVFGNERGGAVAKLDKAMRLLKAEGERATPHDLRRTHGTMITRLEFGRDAMN